VPRPKSTRAVILAAPSDGKPKTHRELVRATGLSDAAIWSALARAYQMIIHEMVLDVERNPDGEFEWEVFCDWHEYVVKRTKEEEEAEELWWWYHGMTEYAKSMAWGWGGYGGFPAGGTMLDAVDWDIWWDC